MTLSWMAAVLHTSRYPPQGTPRAFRREVCMELWRRWAVLVGGLVLLADTPALAQGLNEVLIGRLSNNCSGLSGVGIDSGGAANPDYGPQLLRLCGDLQANAGTGTASSAGGITSAEDRISIGDQRIRRRTQERRAASADGDGGRGFGLFFTADYERFEQDTTRFEAGFGRDTVGGTVGVD